MKSTQHFFSVLILFFTVISFSTGQNVITEPKPSKGTILLFTDGCNEINTGFISTLGFNVVKIDKKYNDDTELQEVALQDAIHAFQKIKAEQKSSGLKSGKSIIMGVLSGGFLAARTVQNLGENEQPDDLILISPSFFDKTKAGSVFPVIMPPLNPKARLFISFNSNDKSSWLKSGQEFSKTWKGYDGMSRFHLLNDSVSTTKDNSNNNELTVLLKDFLATEEKYQPENPNPATVPVPGYNINRHNEKLKLVADSKYDLVMMGNSITHNFEKPEYRPVWDKFFAPRNAINLGFSAYRTENILWNILNGQLQNQTPKVIVLEIGTNNVDEKNYPTRHTAGQLAGGIEAIVKLIREKTPTTRIIILRCFPGCYGGPNPTSHRFILERTSEIFSGIADDKHIFYCDVNHVFLNPDGSINKKMMNDWLHPTPEGALAWAIAMEPLLSRLMGDSRSSVLTQDN